MSVFISYSHADAEFAERLAAQLVKEHTQVWIDRWELNVGDSLIGRIEKAVVDASALVIVLTKASVASDWCRRELTAGLVRELEEKRVIVMPVLLEDCDIPLFLRDKKYANFRSNFDTGLADLLTALARVMNDTRSRIERPDWHTDWAIDWTRDGDHMVFRLTFVEQAAGKPYSCLAAIHIRGNEWITDRYTRYAKEGLDWVFRRIMLETIAEAATNKGLRMRLADPLPQQFEFGIADQKHGLVWSISGECRLLGEDTGFDVLLDVAGMLAGAVAHVRASTRAMSEEEKLRLQGILAAR